jgi:polar amino acid transport system substrate-binding protein
MYRMTGLFVMMAVVVVMLSGSAIAETVRLTNGEWPPFQSENGLKYHGVLSRIVTEAFASEGISVEYGFFPWKRAINYAREAKWDGSFAWAYERPDFKPDFYFSNPIVTVPKAIFHLKSKPLEWKTVDDLKGLRIGVTAGFTYGEAFDRAVKEGKITVEEVALDEQNIRKLLAGRFDAFAMEIDVAMYLMQTSLLPKEADLITYHPNLLMEARMSVIFPKTSEKSPHLVETLNRGLQKLKDSGKLDQYLMESRQGKYIIR